MTAARSSPSRWVSGTTARAETSRIDRSPEVRSVSSTTATANPTKIAIPPKLGVGLWCQRSGDAADRRVHLRAAPRITGVSITEVSRARLPTRSRRMMPGGFTSGAILGQP